MTKEQELESKILHFRMLLKNIECKNDIPFINGKVVIDVYDDLFNIESNRNGEIYNVQ